MHWQMVLEVVFLNGSGQQYQSVGLASCQAMGLTSAQRSLTR